MPKRKLTEIANDFEISFEKAQDIVTNNLEEDMVTGRGKGTWINDAGQKIFDDLIPITVIYRGQALSLAPNPNYIMVYIKELAKKVPVKAPMRYSKGLVGKFVQVEADNKGPEPVYIWRRTKWSDNT